MYIYIYIIYIYTYNIYIYIYIYLFIYTSISNKHYCRWMRKSKTFCCHLRSLNFNVVFGLHIWVRWTPESNPERKGNHIEFCYVWFNIKFGLFFWLEEHVWICLGVPVRVKYSSCLTHWRRIPWVRVSELVQQTVWGFNIGSTWSWVEDGWRYWSDLTKKENLTLTALFSIYTSDTYRCWTSLEMVVQQRPSQSKWKLHDRWYDRKLFWTVSYLVYVYICICFIYA